MFDNWTYRLSEFDGTILQGPIVGKRVKIFKKWNDLEPYILPDNNSGSDEQASLGDDQKISEDDGSEVELGINIGISKGLDFTMDREINKPTTSTHTGGCADS